MSFKRIKSFKLFEQVEGEDIEFLIKNVLGDLSDDGLPVEVTFKKSDRNEIFILVGDEDNPIPSIYGLANYISNFQHLNDEMSALGYQFENCACWIYLENQMITRPITVRSFDKFLEQIEEVKKWNAENELQREFILFDIMYSN